MLRRWSLSLLAVAGLCSLAGPARAQDGSGGPPDPSALAPPAPRATLAFHAYSLAECVALAERNFPSLWAARARLALAHAQLEEARWTPWFQWSAQGALGVTPPLPGTVLFPLANQAARNVTSTQGLQPFASFGLSGLVPLYTFGKIDAANRGFEANVRVEEWDAEKWRRQTLADVRRTYFTAQSARDTKYLVDEALDRLAKAITGMKERLAKGDPKVTEADRLRLELFRQDVTLQSLQADKGEAHALATLRFLTGVQVHFDVVDAPLERPARPLAPIVEYLEAARLLRPDVNMARAGVIARRAQADYNRAKLFPDLGFGLGANFISTPSAVSQQSLWAYDPYNSFYYYYLAFGLHWSLDLLPQAARTAQAESQLAETRSVEELALGNAMHEVEKAYADVVEAKAREETWDRAEHVAKEWLAIAQDHIDVGTWDERSLLEPLRSYGSARAQHVTALLDYNVAMSNLALASGRDEAAAGADR